MNYHVQISLEESRRGECESDLTKEELNNRFVFKYRYGDPIVINGRTVNPGDIERINVYKSEEEIQHYINKVRKKDRKSSVAMIGGPSDKWRAISKTEDITDELIKGPSGYKAKEEGESGEKEVKAQTPNNNKAFIVHGQDHSLKNDLEAFLNDNDINPIVLHRQPDSGRTIIEKFEDYSDVGFAFILLTPDDVAFSKEEFEKLQDEDEEDPKINFRARQNVLFEAGYFVGKMGRSKVCLICAEEVDLPSDLHGLIYQEIESHESIEDIGYGLIQELKNAGLNPDV